MAQQEIDVAIGKYLETVNRLEIVKEVIFRKEPEGTVRIFNVMQSDFSNEQADDPKHTELSEAAVLLEKSLGRFFTAYVSYVNPSELEGFLVDVKRKGFELKRLPIPVNIFPQ